MNRDILWHEHEIQEGVLITIIFLATFLMQRFVNVDVAFYFYEYVKTIL